jgi:hypothetical protein
VLPGSACDLAPQHDGVSFQCKLVILRPPPAPCAHSLEHALDKGCRHFGQDFVIALVAGWRSDKIAVAVPPGRGGIGAGKNRQAGRWWADEIAIAILPGGIGLR